VLCAIIRARNKQGGDKMKYEAVLKGGVKVRAEKKGGKWLIGGDYDLSQLSYIIRLSDNAQFYLKGNRLIRV
jgi:hypothetical protein